MDIALRYVTRFVYPTPVWESHNALRACPAETPTQHVRSYAVEIEPEAAVLSHVDRWGTRVDSFGIVEPHGELVVAAAASVQTEPPPAPSGSAVGSIDEAYRDSMWQFLQPTRHTGWDADVALAAKRAAGDAADAVLAARAVEELVHDSMTYHPGSTEIGVDVAEVWRTRSGVCQDYAHLTIAMLRSVGIGARYVSGYFYASDPTAANADDSGEVVVATHAWVEVGLPGGEWWAIDPTNLADVGERHIKIGHGRDYDDVTPLRGVYYGETGQVAVAEVTMSTATITHRRLPGADDAALQQIQQ